MSENYTDITKTELWTDSHNQSSVTGKMWRDTIWFSIIIYLVVLLYTFIQRQTFSFLNISIAFMGAGGILIGLSFALSGLCYYFDFADRKIAYRKHIGLMGYFFALSYAISLLFQNPDKYFYGFFDNLFTAEFILGLSAISILTLMALVSNNWAMKKLGMKTWKAILQLGYLAYLLLIIRAVLLDYPRWVEFFNNFNSLPPVRLLLAIYATAVLLLRFSLLFVPRKKTIQ